jgi:hypothetical protein
MVDARSDNVAKERNNTEKSRYLRITPAHSIDRTWTQYGGWPPGVQVVGVPVLPTATLRLGQQFDTPAASHVTVRNLLVSLLEIETGVRRSWLSEPDHGTARALQRVHEVGEVALDDETIPARNGAAAEDE